MVPTARTSPRAFIPLESPATEDHAMHLASRIKLIHTQAGRPERVLSADVDFYCPPHLASYTFSDDTGSTVGSVVVPRTLHAHNVAQWVARELERIVGGRIEVVEGVRNG